MKINVLIKSIFAGLILIFAITGCNTKVEQGNYLDATKIQQVQVGMTADQVIYLLGSPLVKDINNPNNWHYVYYSNLTNKEGMVSSKVTVIFNNAKRVIDIKR